MNEQFEYLASQSRDVSTGQASNHPLLDDFLSCPTNLFRSEGRTVSLPAFELVNVHPGSADRFAHNASEGDVSIPPADSNTYKSEHREWSKDLLDFEKVLLDEISKTGQERNKDREFGILLHLRAAMHDIKSGTGDVNIDSEARFSRCKAEYHELKGAPQKAADELIKAIAITLSLKYTLGTSEDAHNCLAKDFAKLADIYRQLGDTKAAEACFKTGIEHLKGWFGNDAARKLCRDYQQFLKNEGKQEEAANWKKIELTLLPSERELQDWLSTAEPQKTSYYFNSLVKELKGLKTKSN